MRKKILGSLAIATIAFVTAFNVNFSTNADTNLPTISLANIEALADGEGGEGGRIPCYNSITTQLGTSVLYCGTCTIISNTKKALLSTMDYCDAW